MIRRRTKHFIIKTSLLAKSALATALLVCGVSSVVAGALGGGFGGAGSGDAIGSLPGTMGGPESGDSSSVSSLPVLVLRGSPAELSRVIAGTAGSGTVEQVAIGENLIELVFHDHVSLWLDKAALAQSSVVVRFDVHPWFGSHVAKVKFDGKTVSRSVRAAVDMPLSLSALLAMPKVSVGAQVSVVLANAAHAKQVFGVQDVGATVRLDQRY
ncbi:MAG: hypothetical protein IT453_04180 [Planctomycetes bacterium]|nr:hypothetical protein [Planctomycetota bacterium]